MLDEHRERVLAIVDSLPEATTETRTGQHFSMDVRGRRFGYFLVDHHGDGRVALCCKVAAGFQKPLIESDPERYFMPPYLGPRGWVGMDLDLGDGTEIDDGEVRWFITESYRLIAPKGLAALLPPPEG